MKPEKLIKTYLEDQSSLSAVDVFSKTHKESNFPKHQKYYQDLIPKRESTEGEQLAFKVDLDTCTGCKACVAGCHSMNGLDEDEAWRRTGSIQGVDQNESFSQTLTSACHHCLEPACAQGCPTMAYEKDPITGIVKHLDDQCFGCRYCELKCPYGVPQFNDTLGIVRKCDMCTERLSEGEAPACVQSCPNGAISITIVNKEKALQTAKESFSNIPQAPDVNITLPTTQYVTKRKFTKSSGTDEAHIKAEHSHLPLVFMLVFTQFSVGAILLATLLTIVGYTCNELILSSFVMGAIGLGVAPLHLGKPHLAFKAFLGFRTSWLSREMLAFGPYPLLVGAALIPSYSDLIESLSPIILPSFIFSSTLKNLALISASFIGVISVFCSAMIYIDTKREFWKSKRTLSFFSSTVLSGAFITALMQEVYLNRTSNINLFICLFTFSCICKLSLDLYLKHKNHKNLLLSSARKLIEGDQSFTFSTRICFGIISGIILPTYLLMMSLCGKTDFNIYICLIISLGWLISEFSERILFFTLALPQKMPGQNI